MVTLADVHTNQLDDPTTGLDGLNCTCAAGAAAAKWRYRGERPSPDPIWIWPPTGGIVRHYCRNEDGSMDIDGGTNLLQVQAALQRGWRVPLAVVTNASFDMLWEYAKDPDTIVLVQFQYSVIHGTHWAASETFMGPHAATIANADDDSCDYSDPLADGRRKGIPKGVQRMERHILREACGKLVVDPRSGRRRGLGRANFAVTRLIAEPTIQDPKDSGDVMFNVGPSATYRDAVINGTPSKPAVLYKDAAMTIRHSAVENITHLGFLGSTATCHVVVNAGNTNYVRRADVLEMVPNERHYE